MRYPSPEPLPSWSVVMAPLSTLRYISDLVQWYRRFTDPTTDVGLIRYEYFQPIGMLHWKQVRRAAILCVCWWWVVWVREVISKVLLIEKLTIVLFPAVSVLENCACLKLLQVSVREKHCICYVVCNVLMKGTNVLALKTKQRCGQPSGILRGIVS
jgi:hypothetical protein